MKSKQAYLFIFLWVNLLLGSCSRKEEDTILLGDPGQLVGNWVLVSPNTGYTITLTISLPTNSYPLPSTPPLEISGKGPVNQYSSLLSYAPDGATPDQRRIRIEPAFQVTKIAENAEQTQVSTTYLRNLGQAYQYVLTSTGELRLYYGYHVDTAPALVYKRQ